MRFGLTAGRVVTFFTDPDLPAPHFGDLRYNDPSIVNVDLRVYLRVRRRALGDDRGRGRPDAPRRRCRPGDRLCPGTDALVYGGQTVPDLVGNPLKEPGLDPARRCRAPDPRRRRAADLGCGGGVIPGTGRLFADTEYGWAVGFHGVVNLPVLGTGDSAGGPPPIRRALSYIGFNNLVAGPSATAGLISVGTPDAVVNVFTNELEKAKGFSIAAASRTTGRQRFRPTCSARMRASIMPSLRRSTRCWAT